jgi:two-component system, OmpR family, sensor histidine kinase SenX3
VSESLAFALVGVVGVLLGAGAVLAFRVSERAQQELPDQPEPVVPPGVGAVLSVVRSSAVVVDAEDHVLQASAPAYALGLVRGDRLDVAELVELVHLVRRDGQIRERDITIGRGARAANLAARVAPLSSRLVLALVDDRTRERRVEAVRRDFVANVSHELKTPVGAIRLLAEAVDEAADDPEAVQRFARRMLHESDRLSRLVQQIIELSRLQGDDPLEMPVQVRIDDVVAAAVDASAIDAAAKDITLVTRGDHELEVFGSEEQIGAAVSNLVANAVHYSNGGSRVLVSTKSMGDTAQISVVDQGIGIPAREIDRIFERFYRVDPARHRSTGGTGLGLSIVKHVAATHGGDVSVWSVEGQGSTFTLTLPLSSQSSTRLAGPTAPVTVVAPRDTSGRRPTTDHSPTRPGPAGQPSQEVRP